MNTLSSLTPRSSILWLTLVATFTPLAVQGEDLYLADDARFPGELWFAPAGQPERLVQRRDVQPNASWPRAVPKIAQVAIDPEGKVFYCSGVDGSLMHLLDGGVEAQAFEIEGQIRDLACTGEVNVVYFSVVATPQNGEPLADGQLFRCDLAKGELTQIATIGQADLGGNWWGTFTIRNGAIYLATLDTPSRIFTLTEQGPQQLYVTNPLRITGLTTGPNGDFWIASGDINVTRTADFVNLAVPFQASTRVGDVAIPAAREAVRVVVHEVLSPTCHTHFVCIRPIPIICFYGCYHPVPWCHHHNHHHYVNNKHRDHDFVHDKIKDAINHGKNGIISNHVLNAAIQDRLGDTLKGKLPGIKLGGNLTTRDIPNLGNKLGGGTKLGIPAIPHNTGIVNKPLNLNGLNGLNGRFNGNSNSSNNGTSSRNTTLHLPPQVPSKLHIPLNNFQNGNNGSSQIKSFKPQNLSSGLNRSSSSFRSNSNSGGGNSNGGSKKFSRNR